MKEEVGTCLLFKFGYVTIFVRILLVYLIESQGEFGARRGGSLLQGQEEGVLHAEDPLPLLLLVRFQVDHRAMGIHR